MNNGNKIYDQNGNKIYAFLTARNKIYAQWEQNLCNFSDFHHVSSQNGWCATYMKYDVIIFLRIFFKSFSTFNQHFSIDDVQ